MHPPEHGLPEARDAVRGRRRPDAVSAVARSPSKRAVRVVRRLVYFVAVSMDGFIADAQGTTRAFATDPDYLAALAELFPDAMPTHVRRQLGSLQTPHRFDTVLLGRRTHQLALDAGLTSAYPHLHQHVFTHRDDLPSDPSVVVHRGRAVDVVADLKRRPGRDMWLCGGGVLAAQLFPAIDELILTMHPIVLGSGVPLVHGQRRPAHCHLRSTSWFDNGVVLLHYERVDR